jgi:hypothetical protein
MAQQLGDDKYDACVKDYARCSFAVPREYVLWLDADALFSPQSNTESVHLVIQSEAKNLGSTAQQKVDAPEILRRSAPLDDKNGEWGCPSSSEKENHPCHPCLKEGTSTYPSTYEDIPYPKIVETLEEQMGGRPEHGSRNNFIFSMACHLRYITINCCMI